MKRIFYISGLILAILIVAFFLFNKKFESNMKIELCENITSGKLKVVCYSIFLKDYQSCKLAGDFSTYCYDSVFPAMELNRSLCESLEENYARLSCFTNLAVKSKDSTVCELLKEPAVVDVCYTNLFSYLNYFKTAEFCNKIPHESTKFACLAKVTNNITQCYDIKQEMEERGVCLGLLTKNATYCTIQQTSDVLSRVTVYSCIKDIAVEMKNMTMCDSIDYQEAKWKCKTMLAANMNICDQADGPWKDFCKIEYIKNNLV